MRQLDAQIRIPQREFSRFLGAVAYLGALGRDGATEALTERGRRLRQRTAEDERRLEEALAGNRRPRMHVIEAEYALSLARAEIAWVDSVIEELRSGTLPWPTGAAPELEEEDA